MRPFVSANWLAQHRNEVTVADVRWYLDGRSGHASYDVGHIPGAVFVDLEKWLAGAHVPLSGRHPLPSPELFARGMSELGIGDATSVVAYDDAGGVIAARLVWMLRVTGHDAAVLDGGIAAYEGELVSGAAKNEAATFTVRAWPDDRFALIDETANGELLVIDARDAVRYRGESEPMDARAGHIPGARSLPCRENLDDDGRLLDDEELRRKFRSVGVENASTTISYCGSGVTACHNLLSMEQCGLGEGRLFPGSWSQYSEDSSRAVTTGANP